MTALSVSAHSVHNSLKSLLISYKPFFKGFFQPQFHNECIIAYLFSSLLSSTVVDSRGILPGGTERGFDWPTSDDEDDDDTLRLNTPPPPLVQHTTVGAIHFP